MLVVALGRRLGLGVGAGVIAVLICFIGGGLGFIGVFADACTSHGFTASQCTLQYVVTHPGTGALDHRMDAARPPRDDRRATSRL